MKKIFILLLLFICLNLSCLLNREIQFGTSGFNLGNNHISYADNKSSTSRYFFANIETFKYKRFSLHAGYTEQKETVMVYLVLFNQHKYKYKTPYLLLRYERPENNKDAIFTNDFALIYSRTYVTEDIIENYYHDSEYPVEVFHKTYVKDLPGIEFSVNMKIVENLKMCLDFGLSAKSLIGLSFRYRI